MSLKPIFISEARVKILSLLLLNPDKDYHVRAIVRAINTEINAVRRELENLLAANIVTRRQSSNRIYYQARTDHPFYPDLAALCAKDTGIGRNLAKKVKDLGEVEFIVLSKAYVRGRVSSVLDVDLFIVGDVTTSVLEKIVKDHEEETGREINYSVMSSEDFKYRKRINDQFVTKILTQSRVMIFGDEEEFCKVIEQAPVEKD